MCTTDLTTALVLQATVSVLHRGWLYKAPQSVPTLNKPNNPNRGQEVLAEIAARFITRLFTCLDYAPAADYAPSTDHGHARLPCLIAYALHRTKLHSSVAALVLLISFPLLAVPLDTAYLFLPI